VLDPIAAEIRVDTARIEVDLSVLPVRLDREYREIRRIAGAVRFAAGAPDVHDAVAAVSVALDRAGLAREMGGGLRGMLGRNVDPLGWVGEHGTLFADPGPAWDELRAALLDPSGLGRWFEEDPGRLPVGVSVAVDQPLALAAFLTAVRGMADQSAPGMTEWTTTEHAGLPIVTVRAPGEQGVAGRLAIHYLAAREGLTVSLNRGVVERAAQRIAARRAGTAAAAALPPAGQFAASADTTWLAGWLTALPASGGMPARDLLLYEGIGVGDLLTEWKLHVPGEDPVAFYERVWGVRPAAMIGGTWRWDPAWMQMINDRIGNPWSATASAGAPDWTRRLPRVWAALDTEPVPASATAARRGDDAIGIRVRIVGERSR
jgi:hypothetical protein